MTKFCEHSGAKLDEPKVSDERLNMIAAHPDTIVLFSEREDMATELLSLREKLGVAKEALKKHADILPELIKDSWQVTISRELMEEFTEDLRQALSRLG